jgi:hypothetical protein
VQTYRRSLVCRFELQAALLMDAPTVLLACNRRLWICFRNSRDACLLNVLILPLTVFLILWSLPCSH